jgi:hypothetical protein
MPEPFVASVFVLDFSSDQTKRQQDGRESQHKRQEDPPQAAGIRGAQHPDEI